MVRVIDLQAENKSHIQQAAALLVAGFKAFAPSAWPDIASALEEVHEALEPGKICRIALHEAGTVVGWIGGMPHYDGRVWELHPLVVDPQHQRAGIGRALIADLEEQVRQRGGFTITLGTDDEVGQTSISGLDLYPDIGHHMQTIRNLHGHPYEFYQKCGFVISGLMPDANGYGKPDIIMAKRVQTKTVSDTASERMN
ncbi:MAG TPA: GNAT family N-acetyltransferase [Caldilineaceae bacterium]|nr:GNAT family N-acetyltransferase [Caldilineaceae bacterium]